VVRGQSFDNPDFSAHFALLGMVSAGKDIGNFIFEKSVMVNHIRYYLATLEKLDSKMSLTILLHPVRDKRGSIDSFNKLKDHLRNSINKKYKIQQAEAREKFSYYNILRFNILLNKDNHDHLIIDGGFTDWTQQLLSNKKERLFTSGFGLEYFLKLRGNN
jgi:hypothetical protein